LDVKKFANEAIKMLALKNPAAITDFIVRVDIFQRQNGQMVVNEFESLEAGIGSCKGNCDLESQLKSSLKNYWKTILLKYINV
jgi:glutathione synthase/RimK-type ligase-like ATP-grasp enzyme